MSNSIINLEHELLLLTLSLYNNPVVPRNVVQVFIENISKFVSKIFLSYVEQQINLRMNKNHSELSTHLKNIMNDV